MKKIISIILIIVIIFSFTSCIYKDNDKDKIKIVLITGTGGVNDQSFNQIAWQAFNVLKEKYDNIEIAYLESKIDADYSLNLQIANDADYDLIFAAGYTLEDSVREIALDNPNKKFVIIDTKNVDLPNVISTCFANEEVGYLVGVVAGMMTKTNKIGYVQGMISPIMNLFGIGYIEGAKSVNKDIEIFQYNANSFSEISIGVVSVNNMVANNADIIFHASGIVGIGVINACVENKIYAIGVDIDQSYIAPKTVITSAIKRVDTAIIKIVEEYMKGEFKGGIREFDLKNNGVDIAETRDLLPKEVIEKVEEVKKDIVSGKIVIPQNEKDCKDFKLVN